MAKARGRKRKPARQRSSRASGGRGRWIARILALGLLFGLLGGVYLLYLDHKVQVTFSGKRWAVPARVYARPLELYPGARISESQLRDELRRLGYRRQAGAAKPGSWSGGNGGYRIRTRSFRFWDVEQPSTRLDLTYRNDLIDRLYVDGRESALFRMEPQEIGSIYPAHREDRVLIKPDELPPLLAKGLVAVEDRSFHEHFGIDLKGIVRAIVADIRAGSMVQGGSTLTQQLVKNFYLTRERSLWRKLNEALMAILLERHFPKQEILGAYANEIYLGQDGQRAIHGFGLASRFYFNQPLKELNLPQIATLVALVRGPSLYDPRRHPERALKRRNLVLDIMADQGVISAKEAAGAKRAPLGVATEKGYGGGGSYSAFMDLVRRQLHRDYREEDLTSEGLRIFTTLDPWIQRRAEHALANRLNQLERRGGQTRDLQAAVVILSSQNAEVQALIGGRNPSASGFNRALDARRPVGSLIKPAVYLTALMQPQRYTLVTPLDDSPVSVTGENGVVWQPRNYDKRSHGQVPLHSALANSYNQATVRLGLELGLDRVLETLKALGIERPLPRVPALLLGAVSLSPLELAQAYQTLAAGGFRAPLKAIREVMDPRGKALQRYPLTVNQVLPAAAVYLIDRNLQEVVRSGTASGLAGLLSPQLSLAGKTGTTDDLRDSWFAGFGGDRVAVVWVGRDDNAPVGLTGSSGALRAWGDIMQAVGVQALVLPRPQGVESVWIDNATGLLTDESCESAVRFPFIEGSAPRLESGCRGGVGSSVKNLFRSFFE